MTFVEASKILRAFEGGPALRIHLAASGTTDPLLLYVRAAAAVRGRSAEVSTLAFGTLGQALLSEPDANQREVVLLMPWDLVPECDWRSGIPAHLGPPHQLLEGARRVAQRLLRRRSRMLYLPADMPPVYLDPSAQSVLTNGLLAITTELGVSVLDRQTFSLGKYLAEGVPVTGGRMGDVAEAIVTAALGEDALTAKVVVTDLDNVLWAGLAAEEGPDGVECSAEGRGFRHFLYQGLLRRLKLSGVLLAAVSRNDLSIARAPIVAGKTMLSDTDFVGILASYEPKSTHIRRLAASLNLGLDAFVFVDDNPVELAEVGSAVPLVRCLQFPLHDDQLPAFLRDLAAFFPRHAITVEDAQRTEMYRRRLAAAESLPSGSDGADLSDFLAGLRMELRIIDRTEGDRQRALQLINKTNQFNLNGRRLNEGEVSAILQAGGRLYTAHLDDRTGSHGEILACLIDKSNCVRAFVLSCRVFQRFVEHGFVCWLVGRLDEDPTFDFAPTERNSPIRFFLEDPAFVVEAAGIRLDRARFMRTNASRLDLFAVNDASDH